MRIIFILNEGCKASVLLKRIFSFSFHLVFLFIIFAVLFYPLRAAALLQWAPTNGPWGGHVTCIEFTDDGSEVYIGTVGGGIFKSTDGGITWVQKVNGISNYSNFIEDVETSANNVVLAAPRGLGVYKSVDGGDSWSTKYDGLNDLYVNDIAVDINNPEIIYIATNTRGVGKSINTGESWASSGLSVEVSPITCLAVSDNGSGGTVIYAGTGIREGSTVSSGIWKSTDQAQTWTRISTGEIDAKKILALGVSPNDSSVLYASYDDGSDSLSNTIYKSTDGGISWSTTTISLAQKLIAESIAVDPVSSEVIYVSTSYHIIKSVDEGASYSYVELHRSDSEYCRDVAIKPDDNSVVYVGNYGTGIFKSNNFGASFEACNNGINNLVITCLEVASVEGDTILYAAGQGYLGEKLGLFKSFDSGNSWSHIDSFDISRNIWDVFIDPNNQEHIYVGVSNGPPCLYRSTDSGGTWGVIDIEGKNWLIDLTADPHSSEVFYAITSTHEASDSSLALANNVFRSVDGGDNWEYWGLGLSESLETFPPNNNYIHAYCIHAAKGTSETVVFLGTNIIQGPLGIYRRRVTTPASSWENVANNLSDMDHGYVTVIADFPAREKVNIAYDLGRMKQKSIYDSDVTWEVIWTEYNVGGYGADIETDPATPYKYYVTSRWSWSEGPVQNFYSFDEQRNPIRIIENYGLPSLNILDINSYPHVGYRVYPPEVPMYIWPVEIDLNSPSGSRTIFSGLPARSVWKAQTMTGAPLVSPTNFSGLAKATGVIRWGWQDNSVSELGFRIYDGDTLIVSMEGNDIEEWVEAGLSTNEAYSRHVVSYNAEGESFPSNIGVCYTLAETPEAPYLDDVGTEYISITWEANGNPSGTNYIIESSTAEGGSGLPIYWEDVGSSMLYPPSFDHMFLEPETVYYYRIRAENHDGIQTLPGEERWFKTATPEPSLDVVPPEITGVKFNGRPYFNVVDGKGDIIYHTPRMSATITDYGSTEIVSIITPEGVDISSVKIRFDTYLFDVSEEAFSLSSTESVPITPESDTTVVYMDFEIPGRLGDTTYICTIEARDRAIPWHSRGIWTGKVRVIGDEARVIGDALCHPTPFKPLTDPYVIISYTLSTNADVTLYIYDISGQIVLTKKFSSGLPGGQAGYNDFTWDGHTDFGGMVANGIFIIKIVSKSRAIGAGKLIVYD